MSTRYLPGILLILAGIILFLNEIDLLSLSKSDIFTYGFIVIGILLLVKGYGRSDKKGILAGTFFLSYGIVLTLMHNAILVRDDEFGLATLFLCIALGNLVYFIFLKGQGNNLIWGAIFALIGAGFLLSYLEYFPTWYIQYLAETYWPLVLIAIGLLLVFKGYRKTALLKSNIKK